MKSSRIKKIVVKLAADNIFEIDVDADIFDDPYLEGATQAIEKCQVKKFGIIRPITDCWEKKDAKNINKHVLINSYWVLVNAALYDKAELLRTRFKEQNDIDLKNEPLKSKNNGK